MSMEKGSIQEKSILVDCLESLKHVAQRYMAAAFECDSDEIREVLQDIAYDRAEQQASVFNLLHQMGLYQTLPADGQLVREVAGRYQHGLQHIQMRHQANENGAATHHETQ